MSQGAGLQVGDDLLDDRVVAVVGLGLEHGQWGVGEHAVVAVLGEQLALSVRDGLGVEPFDPAHDQPAVDVLALASGGERGEGDLGDLGVGDEPLLVVVPDGVRVLDRGPCRLGNARDRCGDSGIHPGGDREPGATAAGRGDNVVGVVRAVSADGDQPAAATRLRGDQGVGDQPGGAPGGVGATPTQPGRGYHRRGRGGRDDGQQRVQTLDPGVPVPGALLGIAVGGLDRVVDIDITGLVGAGQDWRVAGQTSAHITTEPGLVCLGIDGPISTQRDSSIAKCNYSHQHDSKSNTYSSTNHHGVPFGLRQACRYFDSQSKTRHTASVVS